MHLLALHCLCGAWLMGRSRGRSVPFFGIAGTALPRFERGIGSASPKEQMTERQRLLSSAVSRRLHAGRHEAAAHLPGRLTVSTTDAEGAAVAQLGYLRARALSKVSLRTREARVCTHRAVMNLIATTH